MKCKCNKNIILEGRLRLGFKTGNTIQIMSQRDAKRIAKLTRRRGYGTMLK